MELAETVGRNIKFFRKRKGWTQKDMLREMPTLTQSRISLIERGGKMLTLKSVEQFSAVLGVAPHELLLNRDLHGGRRASELAELLESLPKKERESLTRVIDAVLQKNGLLG